MSEILKQRLVGALILLALGVVFWPIIFVEPEDNVSAHAPQAIPEPPAVSRVPVAAPRQGELRGSPALSERELREEQGGTERQSDGDVVTDAVVPESSPRPEKVEVAKPVQEDTAETVVRTVAPQPLSVDADGVPVAWTLQVATVSSAAKAETLRTKLLQKNEKAYVTTITRGGKQLYRVAVGPKFERQELEKVQASIDAEFRVKTMLVRYKP